MRFRLYVSGLHTPKRSRVSYGSEFRVEAFLTPKNVQGLPILYCEVSHPLKPMYLHAYANPKPETLNPKPETLNPKAYANAPDAPKLSTREPEQPLTTSQFSKGFRKYCLVLSRESGHGSL